MTVKHPRGLRVLLVDDDSMVLAVTSKLLSAAGHVVTATSSGREALDAFAQDPTYDVLLTDESMAGMTGTTLIGELRQLRPTLPCVLMTGRLDDAVEARARALGSVQIVEKPFSRDLLLAAIERPFETPEQDEV